MPVELRVVYQLSVPVLCPKASVSTPASFSMRTNRLHSGAGLLSGRAMKRDDIFRIALHEAGHVFGFEDSSDPTDVMHAVGIPQVSQPSVGELDELWARFGQRSADFNERGGSDNNNNAPGRATHMYSSSSGFDGTTPLINHGDLNANDVDYYRFDNLDEDSPAISQEYVGDVTFEFQAPLDTAPVFVITWVTGD